MTDNFEEPQELSEDDGQPDIHAIVEYAIRVENDLLDYIDPELDPMEQAITFSTNSGMLLNLVGLCIEMYSIIEDMSEEDMEFLEEYVARKQELGYNSSKH